MAWPLGTSHPHSTLLLTASHIDNMLSSSKRVGNNCKVEQGITCQISESICLPGLRLLDSSSQGKCLIIPDCELCLSLLCCHTCVDASWVSLHSGHGVVSQQCLALPVQREGFLFAVEITPYLSGSYEAADRLQIPVVKDNPLLTCPAPLVCSHTANVVPAGWGGSFFFFSYVHDKKQENEKLCETEKIAGTWQGMTSTWAICQFQRDIWSEI